MKRTIASIILTILVTSLAFSQTIWTGTVSADWHVAANWTLGVPDLTMEAEIPPIFMVNITMPAEARKITNDGNLNIVATGSLSIQNSFTEGLINNGVLIVDGGIEIFNVNSDALLNAISGLINIGSLGQIIIGESAGVVVGNAIVNFGDINNDGSIKLINIMLNGINNYGGTFINNKNISIADAEQGLDNKSIFNNNSGVLEIISSSSNGIINTGTLNNNSNLVIDTTAQLGFINGLDSLGFILDGIWNNMDSTFIFNTSEDAIANNFGVITNESYLEINHKIQGNGIINHAEFINSYGSELFIKDILLDGIVNLSNFKNYDFIELSKVSNDGIKNGSLAENGIFDHYFGIINISQTAAKAIHNLKGDFNNEANIQIYDAGVFNLDLFENKSTSTLDLDDVNGTGIENLAVFNNLGIVDINRTVLSGIVNGDATHLSNFTNSLGMIIIDSTSLGAIVNVNGGFNNHADIQITNNLAENGTQNMDSWINHVGSNLGITKSSDNAVYNEGNYLNEATIAIDSCTENGIINLSSFFSSGDIDINKTALAGIANGDETHPSTFTNMMGSINTDSTSMGAIHNTNGFFNNHADIQIGNNLFGDAVFNLDIWTNHLESNLKINKSSESCILNMGKFHNYSDMDIDSCALDGITNGDWPSDDAFFTHYKGTIDIFKTDHYGIHNGKGVFKNRDTILIDSIDYLYGFENQDTLINDTTGYFRIGNATLDGLRNDEYVLNRGTIFLKDSLSRSGIVNFSEFINDTTGYILTKSRGNFGVFNFTGLFYNQGLIEIDEFVEIAGFMNFKVVYNYDTGTILIKKSLDTGLASRFNYSGFYNDGMIDIGPEILGPGLELVTSGLFTNSDTILVRGVDIRPLYGIIITGGGTNFQNFSTGYIDVENTEKFGLGVIGGAVVDNYGQIKIHDIPDFFGVDIYNGPTFTNREEGIFEVYNIKRDCMRILNSGTSFINMGFLKLDMGPDHLNDGIYTNPGARFESTVGSLFEVTKY